MKTGKEQMRLNLAGQPWEAEKARRVLVLAKVRTPLEHQADARSGHDVWIQLCLASVQRDVELTECWQQSKGSRRALERVHPAEGELMTCAC